MITCPRLLLHPTASCRTDNANGKRASPFGRRDTFRRAMVALLFGTGLGRVFHGSMANCCGVLALRRVGADAENLCRAA